MIIRRIKFYALLVAFAGVLTGCNNSGGGDIAKIVEERDSLRYETQSQRRQLANIDTLVSVINGGLDSIAREENVLFISSGEGTPSRADVLKKVGVLKQIIANQRQKIASLEQNIANQKQQYNDGDHAGMAALLANVKKQLEEKDREIEHLKQQLQSKDVDIANLRQQISQQSQKIADLDKRATAQNEALQRQDAMLNQCYMIVAPKKLLEQKGIIKKGKIVAQAALDRSKFAKVDIRKFTELTFSAKRPKILTSMPASAYTLTTDGDHNFTLHITNPSAFWSVSNYLVISTD